MSFSESVFDVLSLGICISVSASLSGRVSNLDYFFDIWGSLAGCYFQRVSMNELCIQLGLLFIQYTGEQRINWMNISSKKDTHQNSWIQLEKFGEAPHTRPKHGRRSTSRNSPSYALNSVLRRWASWLHGSWCQSGVHTHWGRRVCIWLWQNAADF